MTTLWTVSFKQWLSHSTQDCNTIYKILLYFFSCLLKKGENKRGEKINNKSWCYVLAHTDSRRWLIGYIFVSDSKRSQSKLLNWSRVEMTTDGHGYKDSIHIQMNQNALFIPSPFLFLWVPLLLASGVFLPVNSSHLFQFSSSHSPTWNLSS